MSWPCHVHICAWISQASSVSSFFERMRDTLEHLSDSARFAAGLGLICTVVVVIFYTTLVIVWRRKQQHNNPHLEKQAEFLDKCAKP